MHLIRMNGERVKLPKEHSEVNETNQNIVKDENQESTTKNDDVDDLRNENGEIKGQNNIKKEV